MKILHRYLWVRLAFGWSLVFLITTSLFSILEFIAQLDDIGEGSYRLLDALIYVISTMPGRVLELAAVSSLLGAIVALGTLANNGELLSLRASGFSVFRIAGEVVRAGSVIMLGTLLLAQFIVPRTEQQAWLRRELALSEAGSLLPSGGFWTRDRDAFVNVRSSFPGGHLADVSVYEFDGEGKPVRFTSAREASIDDSGRWTGTQVRQISFGDPSGSDRKMAALDLEVFLNVRQVDILSITPAMLSLTGLYQYIQVLRERGQNPDQYLLALWQKVTLPLKIAAMVFFSLPFVFGPARDAHPGRRVTLGAIIGISYYYFDQALGYTGLLIGLHPAWTTLLPLGIIFLLTNWLLLRVR